MTTFQFTPTVLAVAAAAVGFLFHLSPSRVYLCLERTVHCTNATSLFGRTHTLRRSRRVHLVRARFAINNALARLHG